MNVSRNSYREFGPNTILQILGICEPFNLIESDTYIAIIPTIGDALFLIMT